MSQPKPWERAQAELASAGAAVIDPNKGGALIASNTATAIASGPEANLIAVFINMVMQSLKQWKHYDQGTWAVPTLCLLGFGIAIGLEHDHIETAIKHGMNYAGQAWVSFRALSPDPIMPPAGGGV